MPVAGALFGGLVSSIASTVVPAMHLAPPPTEQSLGMNLFMGDMNMVYGGAVAVVYGMLA